MKIGSEITALRFIALLSVDDLDDEVMIEFDGHERIYVNAREIRMYPRADVSEIASLDLMPGQDLLR